MQRNHDNRLLMAKAVVRIGRSGRALLPFMLAPCLPALVACSTADERADNGAQITPDVVARTGPPPLLLRPLSKNDAVALNRRLPFSVEPRIPAAPFAIGTNAIGRARALNCLTSAIYYEAASESDDGQRAVAQVVLNRVRHPAFPASVCGVVHQGSTLRTGCQFSFTCDGSFRRVPGRKEWDRAAAIAASALAGAVYAPVGLATHYHADYVVPYWAPSLAKATQVGAHIFYRWAGAWGRTPSFTQRYAGNERDPLALRNMALLSHGMWPVTALPAKPRLALTVDPEVELEGVLRMLASASTSAPGSYERLVRNHFQAEAGGPLLAMLGATKPVSASETVELPAAAATASEATTEAVPATAPVAPVLAAATPVPLSFRQLATDFARQTKFPAFLRARGPLYKSVAGRVAGLAEQAAIDWETYTGDAVAGGKAVISLAPDANASICPLPSLGTPAGPVMHWPADPRSVGPADVFVGTGLARTSLMPSPSMPKAKAKALRATIDPIADQLAAAIFTRIAALSRGETVGNAMLRAEVAKGNRLVPMLADRLRFFEQHRSEYSTLSAFLPTLTAGVAPLQLPEKFADDSAAKSSCPASIAAAS